MNSVSSPAIAGSSALPVASIAVRQATSPRVPSSITTTAPATRPSFTTTPFTNAPNQISAPALRCSARYHSPFAWGKTLPVARVPASTSRVKPMRLPNQ